MIEDDELSMVPIDDVYYHDYALVIVDEAHERSLNIDFLLG